MATEMNRRHFMKHAAAYSALALPGIQFARTIQANAQELRRNNKSVVILWMGGGPATIDIWDLKPGRPTGGPFREVQTRASGVKISEHMPKTAEVFNNLVAIRSLTTTEGDHMRGRQLMHTSYTPNPAIAFPSLGAVASHEIPKLAGYREISLPNYVGIGGGADGPGFLGMNYSAFTVQNPGPPPQNIRPPSELGSGTELEDRIRRRQRLFYELENRFMYDRAPHLTAGIPETEETRSQREAERAKFADGTKAHRDIYYKGFSLVASKEGKVFDLKGESAKTLEDYGNSQFGRSALLARRLIESGVSAVELTLGGWDTHNANFDALSTRQLPPLDRAMSSLVRDLVDRGRWKDTVLCGWASSLARRASTRTPAATTGRAAGRSWSVAAPSRAAKPTAPPTKTAWRSRTTR